MPTALGMDQAEWTFTDDLQTVRSDQGGFFQNRTENPWAFVRFSDPGEVRQYVVPINGAAWPGTNGQMPGRYSPNEVMPYLPFPLESARAARTSDSRDPQNAGGPVAVHFFGWI